ncbi:DUF2249 domain-containing protein [Micromonospora zhanjiangensis]
MSPKATSDPDVQELDVRGMRKPDKHPTIFATYAALPVGAAFVLVNDHDPQHLHEEFETDHAGSYRWEYLNREMRDWRIQITKLAGTPLPRVLVDTTTITADTTAADVTGAVWKLQPRERDLDANVIALPPGQAIDAHTGPDLDVLVHVLAGSGQLTTELGTIELTVDAAPLAPTVHRRRRGSALSDGAPAPASSATGHQQSQNVLMSTSGGSLRR